MQDNNEKESLTNNLLDKIEKLEKKIDNLISDN